MDNDLLLQRVERQFGLCGTALQWVRSYLSGRTFRVVYGDVMSFIMATLWNRACHYIFVQWFLLLLLLLLLYSSPSLSRRRLDVDHTSTHNVALVRI